MKPRYLGNSTPPFPYPSSACAIRPAAARCSSANGWSAAARTGSVFVDLYAASKGHDVCAGKDAWVNGVRTDTSRAAALHPFAEEQRAAAGLIVHALEG